MPSSFFTDRLQRFADALGDEKTKRRITDYLRQCDFPGPVVTLVGAEGRGKSTLFTKATHLSVEPEDRVNCAGATDWKKTVKNHLKVLAVIFTKSVRIRSAKFCIATHRHLGQVSRTRR